LKKEAIHFLLFRAEHQNLIIHNNGIRLRNSFYCCHLGAWSSRW